MPRLTPEDDQKVYVKKIDSKYVGIISRHSQELPRYELSLPLIMMDYMLKSVACR